ncbi:hopanoid biosynthesis-associated protein HpnK [Altericista sp. CCNU0014]|uniref:hopanoid biosynthesis-associated protein HpnK n=1 Tax=Altericista sp. CCNU0014 TaxID=3082949 RepID=UPI00384C48F3
MNATSATSPGAMDSESPTSQRFAIVNGDDFGFSVGVNQAIVKAHREGVLTSTSLMVTGAEAEAAIALARQHPTLGVGLHLVLVCGRAALPAAQIPHLVDAGGNFPNDPAKAGLKYQFCPAARQELRLEIRAQLERFRQSGLKMSHVDGHLHLHAHPVVLDILIDLAPEFEIRAIRLPFEELNFTLKLDSTRWFDKAVGWWIFGQLRRRREPKLRRAGIHCAQRVYGLLKTGEITEDYLAGLIPQIQAECIEIYAHPAIAIPGEPHNGTPGAGEKELEALLSDRVRDTFAARGFRLTQYGDPRAFPPSR